MKRNGRGGFTVVEVIMVIALLGAMTALVVVPVHRLVEAFKTRPLEEVVLAAIRSAHIQARQRNRSVVLSYVGESNALWLATRDGILIEEIPVERPDRVGDKAAMLVFRPILPEEPEGKDNAFESADDPVGSVLFHPNGASMPFAVEVRDGASDVRLVLDPFSSEPLLREQEGQRP